MIGEEEYNVVYLWFKLDNTFVKSWSISGDADDRPTEDVALWYNKIGFRYFATEDGKTWTSPGDCCWDNVSSKRWEKADISNAEADIKIKAQ
jgi:type VI secretion system secreted protein Hcp